MNLEEVIKAIKEEHIKELKMIKAEFEKVSDEELNYYWHKRDKFIEIIDKYISGKK